MTAEKMSVGATRICIRHKRALQRASALLPRIRRHRRACARNIYGLFTHRYAQPRRFAANNQRRGAGAGVDNVRVKSARSRHLAHAPRDAYHGITLQWLRVA
jgi:hypothetical protein